MRFRPLIIILLSLVILLVIFLLRTYLSLSNCVARSLELEASIEDLQKKTKYEKQFDSTLQPHQSSDHASTGKDRSKEDILRIVEQLIQRNASYSDPEVLDVIHWMLQAPSGSRSKLARQMTYTPQAKAVDKLLNEQVGGFFVESGAYDGEVASNTIYFERLRNWTGLLIEPQPVYYQQLVAKRRNSWSINACLSPQNSLTVMNLKETEDRGQMGRMTHRVKKSKHHKPVDLHSVPCFPLSSLLTALNLSTVDYLSLDVEGMEMEILETIPFEKFVIKSISTEFVHSERGGNEEYTRLMISKGYELYTRLHVVDWNTETFVDDLIFKKKELT